jgi:hypothetical protein
VTPYRSGIGQNGRSAFSFLLALLASISTGGCYASTECTAADTTHSCCVKKHPRELWFCDGLEGAEEAANFRTPSTHTQQGPALSAKELAAITGAAAGGAILILIRGNADELDELQDALDPLMEECARRAEQTVNRLRLGGKTLSPAECNEQVGVDKDGKPVTRAMALGNEKHEKAFACVEEKLGRSLTGYFIINQRYRFNSKTRQYEPISKEEVERLVRTDRKKELTGSLEPDVVIHSGNPTRVRFIYDFKFPCTQDNLPTWRAYSRGPHRDQTQGEAYLKAFGVKPARVSPRDGVIR